ncbi:hypothetical protein ASPTUDRAFT_75224 [Aspergillus tubingensis CBS 134.48]|uniref:Uncharacterized protein n=1 Tax=Aspergillus tubingensis (strain CBS 134.48) TaxID=767770 RepID=A0A1L9N9B2_ASPTC|nr:hypothetical protein ASPTUDRAFT_75224 [Aspergillus tubingensis CBS 134.48]
MAPAQRDIEGSKKGKNGNSRPQATNLPQWKRRLMQRKIAMEIQCENSVRIHTADAGSLYKLELKPDEGSYFPKAKPREPVLCDRPGTGPGPGQVVGRPGCFCLRIMDGPPLCMGLHVAVVVSNSDRTGWRGPTTPLSRAVGFERGFWCVMVASPLQIIADDAEFCRFLCVMASINGGKNAALDCSSGLSY